MPKILVVYESKYGNTKRAAEMIIEGLREAGATAEMAQPKAVDRKQLGEYDAIVIGSPTHAGMATFGIRRFVGGLGKLDLSGKHAAVFDCRAGPEVGKVVHKLEKQLGEKVSGIRIAVPGISLLVVGMKGPLADGELERCREFGKQITGKLTGA